jgi:hypothetical protein
MIATPLRYTFGTLAAAVSPFIFTIYCSLSIYNVYCISTIIAVTRFKPPPCHHNFYDALLVRTLLPARRPRCHSCPPIAPWCQMIFMARLEPAMEAEVRSRWELLFTAFGYS